MYTWNYHYTVPWSSIQTLFNPEICKSWFADVGERICRGIARKGLFLIGVGGTRYNFGTSQAQDSFSETLSL